MNIAQQNQFSFAKYELPRQAITDGDATNIHVDRLTALPLCSNSGILKCSPSGWTSYPHPLLYTPEAPASRMDDVCLLAHMQRCLGGRGVICEYTFLLPRPLERGRLNVKSGIPR